MGKSFKENLREMLDYRGMTVKELAFKTEIPKRSIENYLNARASIPPADYACKIANALDTSVEFLVEGATPKKVGFEDLPSVSDDLHDLVKIYQNLLKKDKNIVQRIIKALAQNS